MTIFIQDLKIYDFAFILTCVFFVGLRLLVHLALNVPLFFSHELSYVFNCICSLFAQPSLYALSWIEQWDISPGMFVFVFWYCYRDIFNCLLDFLYFCYGFGLSSSWVRNLYYFYMFVLPEWIFMCLLFSFSAIYVLCWFSLGFFYKFIQIFWFFWFFLAFEFFSLFSYSLV